MNFSDFFLEPLYRAPFLGSMLMCLASSLMGTLLFVQRKSLLGETLSHAAYPGVVFSAFLGALFFDPSSFGALLLILGGAALFAYLGLLSIEALQKRLRIHSDAALCLILSLSLGLGVLCVSRIQFSHPLWYQQAQVFIYGQAATMTDTHILIYGALSFCVILFVVCFFRAIERFLFDSQKEMGKGFSRILFFLLIISIVVGIRSVGVILMAGMLIAPIGAARSFSDRLSHLLPLSALFGVSAGFGGNYVSVLFAEKGVHLPTGPGILLVAAALALLSLVFSPKRGAFSRLIRKNRFRRRCLAENILKTLWKGGEKTPLSYQEITKWNTASKPSFQGALFKLKREGWIIQTGRKQVGLTSDGIQKAARLVRLHRLWELYLVSCLKADEKRVHYSAEEMEHILTPELENRLSSLLNHPTKDPHQKPIPQGEG
ncbi:MAG: metal ABC transporter permease [Chlamydiia bacterium]|nr:metal ABC transporter permease [Chlamydiia bacterium]